MSYNGRVEYGLLADYDAVPDIQVIADGLDEALGELLESTSGRSKLPARGQASAARASNGAGGTNGGGHVSILPSSGARPKRGPASDMRAKRSQRRGSAPKRREG
jgi:hypothetical protein